MKKSSKVFLVLIVILLIISAYFFLSSRVEFTAITGKIVDDSGNPISNADVEIYWQGRGLFAGFDGQSIPDGFMKIDKTTSNQNGEFKFTQYSAGFHPLVQSWKEIRVKKQNYCSDQKIIPIYYAPSQANYESCLSLLKSGASDNSYMWPYSQNILKNDADSIVVKLIKLDANLSSKYQIKYQTWLNRNK